jgi:transketolase
MWDKADLACVHTVQALCMDQVQRAQSGHPGAPMALSPLAHVLFSRHLRQTSEHPNWLSRDRFVLSNGHACALHYSLLHLTGYLSLEDLRSFRQLHSR